jgi:flagellar biosynthesis regulator FlaF
VSPEIMLLSIVRNEAQKRDAFFVRRRDDVRLLDEQLPSRLRTSLISLGEQLYSRVIAIL